MNLDQSVYLNMVRLLSSGNVDKARVLLEQHTTEGSTLRKDIEDALLRDTGRTIT